MREFGGFVIFALAVYGLANAISVLKAGRPLRWLAARIPPWYRVDRDGITVRRSMVLDLLECPPCLSFWIGLLMSLLIWSPMSTWIHRMPEASFVDGLACSAVSWVMHVVTDRVASDRV